MAFLGNFAGLINKLEFGDEFIDTEKKELRRPINGINELIRVFFIVY